MSRKLRIILSLILLAYLAAASAIAIYDDGRGAVCRGVKIEVDHSADTTRRHGAPFVTRAELARELDSLPSRAAGMLMESISPQRLRRRLERIDKIEDVQVLTLTDGTINIRVTPIVPVMRVFDGDNSYYVNRQGKRVKASARYRANVPVVMGRFPASDTAFAPLSLMPVIDFLNDHPLWGNFITMIRVDSPNDIILVPAIREHVINIGSPTGIEEKMERLKQFYTLVLPVKGWDAYTMLSLKWKGQLVATRRPEHAAPITLEPTDDEGVVDIGTMLVADDVAPGQALKGRKANNDLPIPANKPAKKDDNTQDNKKNNHSNG